MSRILKFSAIALLSVFMFVPPASAHPHSGVVVGGGFGYGPGWGWYGPAWGWYGTGWWYGPYSGYPYAYYPDAGAVKIVNTAKDAQVYVDGGYAGTVGKLKKFPLRPGNHNIELRDPSGHVFHQERVHVIPGKTIEIEGGARGH